MKTESYLQQLPIWPISGQHILAQYDESTITVYQAYRPSIGRFAADNQRFGGEFSFKRMSWIKTNFLWMMYRSGWGSKEDQEVTLAVRIKRPFFEKALSEAVPSTYDSNRFTSRAVWKEAVGSSEVRLQWDPDHDPTGAKVERRALQIGLRNSALKEYGQDAVVDITDISSFVSAQREFAYGSFEHLVIPKERVFKPESSIAVRNAQLNA